MTDLVLLLLDCNGTTCDLGQVVHVQPSFVKGLQTLGHMPLLESGSGPLVEAHNALCVVVDVCPLSVAG